MAARALDSFPRWVCRIALALLCASSLAGAPATRAPSNDLAARVDSLFEAAAYEQALRAAVDGLALVRATEAQGTGEVVAWLVRVGRCRIRLSRLDDARAVLDEAVAVEAARPAVPDSIALELKRALCWLAHERWDSAAMLESARECIDLSRKLHGRGHPRVAEDLITLAKILIELNRGEEAVAPLGEAEGLVVPAWGRVHETMAEILAARAALARSKGDLEEAIVLLEQSVEIVKSLRGDDHPNLGHFMRGLGEAHRLRGDLDEAESYFRRILEIETAAFGRDHPRTGMSLNNLGVVLKNKGDLSGAAQVYERSLSAQLAGYGEDNPDVALTMINLSSLKTALGRQAEALRLLRRAVAVMESSMGPEHTRTAWAMSHLAQAQRRCGAPRAAEALFRRSLAIAQMIHGRVHSDVALYWIGIAQSLRDQGRLDEALAAFRTADSIGTVLLDPESVELARYRREVGGTLILLGLTEEARPILETSMATIEREEGPEHPALNACVAGLIVDALLRGDVDRARKLADRNLAAAEHVFGESALRRSLLLKLAVEVAGRDWETAAEHGIRAAEIALQTQDDFLQVASEREMLQFAEHSRRVLGGLLAALQTTPEAPDSILAAVFSLGARQHGRTVDHFAERRHMLEMAVDTSVTGRLYERYRLVSERLAECQAAGARGNPDEYRESLTRAREEKAHAERHLAEALSDHRFRIARADEAERLAPGDIAARLEPGTTLIQFVRFPVLSIHTKAWRPGAPSIEEALYHGRDEHYGAFRLRVSSAARWTIDFTDLGEAPAIDSLVASYRRSVVAVRPGRRPTVPQEAAYRKVARHLAEAIWTPLLGTPESRRRENETDEPPFVLLVPTSMLHLIDFNTLLTRDGNPVIDSWKLHYLSSVRDLIRDDRTPGREGAILSVGNPERTHPLDLCPDRIALAASLPGAEEEAREISALFTQSGAGEALLLTGGDATETAVKRWIEHARIAHLAAHGFFCEALDYAKERQDEVAMDPLLRCGIVLASGAEGDDGLLTAQEIVARDLRDLDWVVLSACESGLGPPVSGEGLYGLRRAFEIAGAHTVITALWRIGDRTTLALMTRLYRNRLEGHSTVDALRAAQLDRLRGERRRNRLHPVSWGGILAEGEWR